MKSRILLYGTAALIVSVAFAIGQTQPEIGSRIYVLVNKHDGVYAQYCYHDQLSKNEDGEWIVKLDNGNEWPLVTQLIFGCEIKQ